MVGDGRRYDTYIQLIRRRGATVLLEQISKSFSGEKGNPYRYGQSRRRGNGEPSDTGGKGLFRRVPVIRVPTLQVLKSKMWNDMITMIRTCSVKRF